MKPYLGDIQITGDQFPETVETVSQGIPVKI